MANHKSAEKAHKQSLARAARNRAISSRIKTFIKKVEAFITEGDIGQARTVFRNAESQIMKGVKKGVIKLNTASRKVSNLSKRIKAADLAKSS